jgi:deoxyribonuclease-2
VAKWQSGKVAKMKTEFFTYQCKNMGQCFTCLKEDDIHVALKFPHGTDGIMFDSGVGFIPCDINEWIRALYKKHEWTEWIAYNDETGAFGNNQHKKGHCKGIIAWNTERISWLIHSVPNFPREFTGKTISDIEPSECIYGQSFVFTTVPFTVDMLKRILTQVHFMEAHVFLQHTLYALPIAIKSNEFSKIKLSESMTHIAKPPSLHMDIYEELVLDHSSKWQVQTWKRGHPLDPSNVIVDIENMGYTTTEWKCSQDHSKWAVNALDVCWIGDLNRMSSQANRGGGGLVIRHPALANGLRELIKNA